LDEIIGDGEGYGGSAEIGYVFHEGQQAQHIIGFESGFITGDDAETSPFLGVVSSDLILIPLLVNYTVSSKLSSQSALFYEIGGGIGAFITDIEAQVCVLGSMCVLGSAKKNLNLKIDTL